MRRKANLIAGAVCGALCVSSVLAYGAEVQNSFEKERAEVLERYGGEQVEVCVATEDIEVGDVLGSANTEKRLWLGELLPEDAVFSIEDMQGKPVSSPIYQGEVITERRFEKSEHVALQVPDGLCAVSVPAKSVSTVGGSVEAGSYVDMYAVSGAATDCIASGVLVLSTSSTEEQSKSDEDIAWVTLAVEPDLVKEVITAAQKSELYFVLPADDEVGANRAETDDERVKMDGEQVGTDADRSEADSEQSESSVERSESGVDQSGSDGGETKTGAGHTEEKTTEDGEQ